MSKHRYLQALADYHYIREKYGEAWDTADSGYTAAFQLVFGIHGARLNYHQASEVVANHVRSIYLHGYSVWSDRWEKAALPVDQDERLQQIISRWI